MPKKHPPETRVALRQAYVYERLPLEAAAERVGVGHATARRWKADAETEGDDWERARVAATAAGSGQKVIVDAMLEDYIRLHASVVDQLTAADDAGPLMKARALAMLADSFAKTMGAAAKASPSISRLAVASEVMHRFAAFLRERDPELIAAFIEVLDDFSAVIGAEFGT